MRRLEAVLADLLARTGAEAARVVDAPTAAVLAEVVAAPTSTGPTSTGPTSTAPIRTTDTAAVLAGLVRVAADAALVADADGGLDDLVVGGRRALHVLRPLPGAAAHLHLRLDPARDGLLVARRWLADPTLHQAILEVLRPAVPRSTTPRSAATVPTPAVVPSQRPAPRPPELRPPELPAITVLAPDPPRSMGALAVLALGPQHREEAGDLPLPRRATAQQSVPEVLDRAWSRDADTLRRILAGLHRLS